LIEIQVEMTDRMDILFSSSPRTRFQGVHSHVDVVPLFVILVTEPLLEGTFRDPCRRDDALNGVGPIAQQDRKPVRRAKVLLDVLGRRNYIVDFLVGGLQVGVYGLCCMAY